MRKCILCQINNKEIPYAGFIKKGIYWTLMLSREQHCLGTMILFFNQHQIRFSSISTEALLEFQQFQLEIEKCLDTLFNPDLYNYLQCGNSVQHLHIHIIPRYKSTRQFDNQIFIDDNYGNTVKETTVIESETFIIKITETVKSKILLLD